MDAIGVMARQEKSKKTSKKTSKKWKKEKKLKVKKKAVVAGFSGLWPGEAERRRMETVGQPQA